MIKFHEIYTHTCSGSIDREVECEACHTTYTYVVKRTAMGLALNHLSQDDIAAHNRSVEIAKQSLESALESGLEIVPCPDCGWYQSEMLPLVRTRHLRWIKSLAAAFSVAAVIVFLVSVFSTSRFGVQSVPLWAWVGMSVLAVPAVLLLPLRFWLASTFDPNAEPVAQRMEFAQRALRRYGKVEVDQSPDARPWILNEAGMWSTAEEARGAITFLDCFWKSTIPVLGAFGGILLVGLAWILAFGKGHDENPIDRFVTAMIAFGPGVWLIHYALKHAITLYRITQEGELTTGVVTGVSTGFNYYFMHQVRYNYTVDGGTHLKGMITSQDYPIGARVIVAYPPENPREGRCIDNLIRSPT